MMRYDHVARILSDPHYSNQTRKQQRVLFIADQAPEPSREKTSEQTYRGNAGRIQTDVGVVRELVRILLTRELRVGQDR